MRQYLIDGLKSRDYKKIDTYLKTYFEPSPIGNIYWVELDRDILTDIQKAHTSCHPHVFALELEKNFLSCELLVRIKKSIKCDCMGYATEKQREWLIKKIDAILEKLDVAA